MKNVSNAAQQKERIIRMADALIAICESKNNIRWLDWGLSFFEFLLKNHQLRGWQALQVWTGFSFIWAQKPNTTEIEDTFYWENKNN